jgi:hypothetical protein
MCKHTIFHGLPLEGDESFPFEAPSGFRWTPHLPCGDAARNSAPNGLGGRYWLSGQRKKRARARKFSNQEETLQLRVKYAFTSCAKSH